MHTLSRRRLLRHSAAALLVGGLWPGRLLARQVETKLTRFVVINDLHFTDAGCAPFFEALVKSIRAIEPAPAAVFLAGDLVENGKAEQFGGLAETLKPLGLPVYAVPGNHDFETMTSCAPYDAAFPDSHNRVIDLGGWQMLLLDSTQGTEWKGTTISDATMHFAAEQVGKLDRHRPTILITHFPFNPALDMTPLNANALLDTLKPLNLVAVFGGHFHGSTRFARESTFLRTNRCCSFRKNNFDGTPEKGYFLCTASEHEVNATFVEFKA